ncbi:MAG: translation initiation factor IF-5A [Thermodesulfobacteriota bacterium]|nr:MAG: translation initiation factor IF-5A [Thermodesulfobacteriota bacterium]
MENTVQVDAGSLKPGRYVVFDGEACVVKSIQTSRPGKHGHAKCRIEAVTLKDGRKIIKVMPGHDKVASPIIDKKTAQVLSVNGDTANVMDMETYETFDLKIPEELQGQVVEGAQVLYWVMLGEKIMKQVK